MDWNNINIDKDTSGLGPIEYDQSKVPQLIRKHADNVRGKSYGQEIREAQARNAEVAGLIAQEGVEIANQSTIIANSAVAKSIETETRYDVAVGALTEDTEVLDARIDSSGTVQDNLKKRIDVDISIKTTFADTVAEMLSMSIKEGQIVQTLGYHQINDGGANVYKVINSLEAINSYDLANEAVGFRPIANGVIHPKMFGTFNDGVQLDNYPLQACYDYAEDMGIFEIDGLGLLYNIGTENELNPINRGWSHTGAQVKAGHKLVNFEFKTANGSTNGTIPLFVLMDNNGKDIYLENIMIDGNKENVSVLTTFDGREDGGLHAIYFNHEYVNQVLEGTYPGILDFFPCGNIYMKNVKVKNHMSYGVRIDHLDCLLKIENSEFDHSGLAIQAHTTRFEVDNVHFHTRRPRANMVAEPIHEEIEFKGRYQGTKAQHISIKNTTQTFEDETFKTTLFKVHNDTFRGARWSKIRLENNDRNGIGLIYIYNGSGTEGMTIDKLEIINNPNVTNITLQNITGTTLVKEFNVLGTNGKLTLGNTNITNLKIDGVETKDDYLALVNGTEVINKLEMSRIKMLENIAYGLIRNSGTVKHISINNSELLATARTIQCRTEKVEMNNVNIISKTDGFISDFLYCEVPTSGKGTDVFMSNIKIHAVGQTAYTTFIKLYDDNGIVHLDNVRFEKAATPNVSGRSATKVSKRNCEPMFAS